MRLLQPPDQTLIGFRAPLRPENLRLSEVSSSLTTTAFAGQIIERLMSDMAVDLAAIVKGSGIDIDQLRSRR
jgi:hypothetical protein